MNRKIAFVFIAVLLISSTTACKSDTAITSDSTQSTGTEVVENSTVEKDADSDVVEVSQDSGEMENNENDSPTGEDSLVQQEIKIDAISQGSEHTPLELQLEVPSSWIWNQEQSQFLENGTPKFVIGALNSNDISFEYQYEGSDFDEIMQINGYDTRMTAGSIEVFAYNDLPLPNMYSFIFSNGQYIFNIEIFTSEINETNTALYCEIVKSLQIID